jgi:hypothetical protein
VYSIISIRRLNYKVFTSEGVNNLQDSKTPETSCSKQDELSLKAKILAWDNNLDLRKEFLDDSCLPREIVNAQEEYTELKNEVELKKARLESKFLKDYCSKYPSDCTGETGHKINYDGYLEMLKEAEKTDSDFQKASVSKEVLSVLVKDFINSK